MVECYTPRQRQASNKQKSRQASKQQANKQAGGQTSNVCLHCAWGARQGSSNGLPTQVLAAVLHCLTLQT